MYYSFELPTMFLRCLVNILRLINLVLCYAGGFCQKRNDSTLIKQAILRLCAELKDDAVSLVDVIAPPDFILNSAIGKSDGQVNIQAY